MKFGLSYVSHDGAYANLKAEISDWDFDQLKENTRQSWNDVLGRIRITDSSASTKIKEIFYTSLYRALLHPDIFSDTDGQYIGFNNSIYTAETSGSRQRTQYQLFSGWDTYRAQMQLVTLIDQGVSSDMAQSLINNSKQANCSAGRDVDQGNCDGGSFTRWGVANDDPAVMAGEPGAIIVANTLAFGGDDFHFDQAIAAMERGVRNRTSKNRANDVSGGERGFTPVPNFNNWGSYVFSRNLELAAANFSKAAFAKILKNNTNNSAEKTMYETKASAFYTHYGLKLRRAQPSGECCGWGTTSHEGTDNQYYWMLPMNAADIPNRYASKLDSWYNGLPASKKIAIAAGDSLEVQRYKKALSALNNHVSSLNAGLKSKKLWFGNEPVHFNPFVYNFFSSDGTNAEEASKGQDTVRRILVDMYNNSIDLGLSGNDDLGCLTAWYVWGAMGLYPAVPGVGVYTITTPLFKQITIDKHDDNGTIIIEASNASEGKDGARYIETIKVQKGTNAARDYNKTYITHDDLYSATNVKLIFTVTDDVSDASRTLEKSPSFPTLESIEDFLE